ncbi:MAG: hypothetical protein ACRENL_04090 [Candidatus Dormibacteria bacterium]
MATLRLRWSEPEARKPYARPFMASFVDDAGVTLGSVALNGADLLYLRQFGAAVAALSGELFILDAVDSAADPQRAWLETLTSLLPSAALTAVTPRSSFDHQSGRVFGFEVVCAGGAAAVVDAPTLLEYQELQAAVAHQTGRLLRIAAVEDVEGAAPRRRSWLRWLRGVLARPAAEEAMAPQWPWR